MARLDRVAAGPDVGDALMLLLIALAAGTVGIVIGMLVAPRLSRWAERDDEEGPKT